ncbi:MAG: universal stress protein [Chloroflexi bacterium]|nr:universal stress protein [Chloroflexota bacterium]MCI0575601.1 universal stress protein [Chloroflexota bacterium]MCI0645062.1 universal stress protein [Chloroflexota bacterium]MCI0731898.1 universal stress protein [Chloroflexota bacterium]
MNGHDPAPRLLLCSLQKPPSRPFLAYAEALTAQLGGQATNLPVTMLRRPDQLKEAVAGCDLVLFEEPTLPLWQRWLIGNPGRRVIRQAPTSTLVVRQARWPLQKILLILRSEETDDLATEWVLHLARSSGAAVTVLVIIPPIPTMYWLSDSLPVALETVLSEEIASGAHLHRLLNDLRNQEIMGMVRLREGAAAWQISQELAAAAYDLVVIGAEPPGRLYRWFMGELAASLPAWTGRPVLVAR